MAHRERLIGLLADGKWHRAEDLCSSHRARAALRALVRENGIGGRYELSWVPVMRWYGRRQLTVRLRVVRLSRQPGH